tara:strand:- start:36 stop:764 length:729 start_codon:yes stop_codon:yes gene_type:complete
MILEPIFATPLASLDRYVDGLEDVIKHANSIEQTNNTYNRMSVDKIVLENENLSELKIHIYEQVERFYEAVAGLPAHLKPIVTQSWFTYTGMGESMHRHMHPNSLFSGVFYVDADRETDYISLKKPEVHEPIMWYKENLNIYNSHEFRFPVHSGDLIMFPSNIPHSFGTSSGPSRISLAFNTFVMGQLGGYDALTALNIASFPINIPEKKVAPENNLPQGVTIVDDETKKEVSGDETIELKS